MLSLPSVHPTPKPHREPPSIPPLSLGATPSLLRPSVMSINTQSVLPDPVFTCEPQIRKVVIKKRDRDSMSFGFEIKKLSFAESTKATRLLAKEFSKEVGPLSKRKQRLQ